MSNTVELVGHYGGDITHAMSGWTSTHRKLTPDRIERIPDFLADLAQDGHHTPFEKSYLHFLVRCETASHIHLLKHRIGVSINAESARYKELKKHKAFVPDDWPEELQKELSEWAEESHKKYRDVLARLEATGMPRKRAKESARFFLPYSRQVDIDVGFNFRSFMHFQGLRNKLDAQKEIRDIAEEMLRQVKKTGDFKYSLEGFGYGS